MWKEMVAAFVLTALVAVVFTGAFMALGSRFHGKFMDDELWFRVFAVVLLGLLIGRGFGWIP